MGSTIVFRCRCSCSSSVRLATWRVAHGNAPPGSPFVGIADTSGTSLFHGATFTSCRAHPPGRRPTMPPPVFDRIVGDTVTLSNTTELRQSRLQDDGGIALGAANVNCQVLLKVDDDSIVHIGRLWAWIYHELPKEDPNAPPPTQLYAGRVFRDSQVVRANFTTADLRRPRWFPASFLKWAVDHSVFPHDTYPPYCGGGGYVLGVDTARKVVLEYDLHYTPARIIPVEDAFVGVLALAQGIAARDLLTFQEPPRGSHQTREMFIDQILVHRVVEPFKAFRWLMLSSNCLASRSRVLSPSTARMGSHRRKRSPHRPTRQTTSLRGRSTTRTGSAVPFRRRRRAR